MALAFRISVLPWFIILTLDKIDKYDAKLFVFIYAEFVSFIQIVISFFSPTILQQQNIKSIRC